MLHVDDEAEAQQLFPFLQLAPELQREVYMRCNPKDGFAHSAVCTELRLALADQAFWRQIISRDFPNVILQNVQDCRSLYHRLFCYRQAQADTMWGAWIGDHNEYLVRVGMTGANSSSVVVLQNVCWLDVCIKLEDVCPGVYNIRWRLMVKQPTYSLQGEHVNIDVQHHPSNGTGDSHEVLRTLVWRPAAADVVRDQWFDLQLAGVKVPSTGAVVLRMHNHSGRWKSGLVWDTAHLDLVAW